MGLSIVIPTYNKWARLRLTLLSLEHVKTTSIFEVIVVDDGSTDDTYWNLKHYAEVLPYPVRIIRHQLPKGRSCARNAGAAQGEFERILFLDDDCLVTPQMVDGHIVHPSSEVGHGNIFNISYVKFFENPATGEYYKKYAGNRKRNGLASCRITEEQIVSNFSSIVSANKKVNALEKLTIRVLSSCKHDSLQWVGCAGGNLSLPTSVWEKYPFDESFGLRWGAEDLDLGIRLYESGYRISLVPDASVYHMDHPRENFIEDTDYSFSKLFKRFSHRIDIELVKKYLLQEIGLDEVLR
jgi:glycosyltransferase involved in cell wall biosynthesis